MKLALQNPVTITLRQLSVSEVSYSITDNGSSCVAKINGFGRPLVLWDANTTPTYSAVGDYTEAQIKARMAELLGTDPAAVLAGLVSPSQRM